MPDQAHRFPWLLVFARAPIAGRTKTRLVPELGAEGVASLYAAFLEDTLRTCTRLDALEPVLYVAEPSAAFAQIAARHAVSCLNQPEGDLGERLRAGLSRGLEEAPWCLAVGSDAPTLPGSLLRGANELLRAGQADVVLGPASDGGYYLIGVRAPLPDLFRGIPWSGPTVLRETRARAEALSRRVICLPPWYDVDTPADLRRLRMHLRLDPAAAPATAAHLLTAAPRPR